jgi:formylglycine-generating enzyme required for sulfatase activity
MQWRLMFGMAALAIFASAGYCDYRMDWSTIDGGGGQSTGGSYRLSGTIGQPDTGFTESANYDIYGGFWPGWAECIVDLESFGNFAAYWFESGLALPADMDGNGVVNLADLEIFVNDWLCVCPADWPLKNRSTLVGDGMSWVTITDPGFTGQMSKYETTNAQYCRFLNAAKATGDITVSGTTVVGAAGTNTGVDFPGMVYYDLAGVGMTTNGAVNGGAARIQYSAGVFTVNEPFTTLPVTYVNWYGATAFCNYYGYRLPTEWEWQAVADFDGTYTYGCGTFINNSMANYFNSVHPFGTTAVGSFGQYGYGLCDLSGNVMEWMSNWYDGGSAIAVRGGTWMSNASSCTVAIRNAWVPQNRYLNLGFRCCR